MTRTDQEKVVNAFSGKG